MNSAVTTTVSLLLIIIIGYLLRGKIKTKDQKSGIKLIILSLALPATIFIALLKIEFDWTLAIIPVLALAFNGFMYLLVSRLQLHSLYNIQEDRYRTLKMLIPSLAPGLSCFPFILEYFGEEPLALAALADIGNKIFVLIILYVIAMNWYFRNHGLGKRTRKTKVKSLFVSLLGEPINLVIISAIIMLSLGLNYSFLPSFIQLSIDRMSFMMTPLILLFIGISAKLNFQQARTIFLALFFRSGIAFLISGIMLVLLPVKDMATMLLIVIFPQSAVSFWPYAHMSVVNEMEDKLKDAKGRKTFDLDFAMNVLACSLPFSTILILIICTFGEFFEKPAEVFVCGGVLLFLGVVPATVPSHKIQSYANKLKAAFKTTLF